MADVKNKLTLPEQEEKILEFWKQNRIFEKSVEQRRKSRRYVFYDGPPFATGLPHYGHILASTIKDVVPRFWAMKGYLVERRWGWDCHGLPIENLVEQDLKISGQKAIEKFGIKKFNEAARSKVLTYASEWEKTVNRIGRFIDFENSYKTMDATYMESVWWVFAELYRKNLIYKDSRISLFCPHCETPLSNFEIAMDDSYEDREDDSIYVKFKLKDAVNEYLLVWTTTPWTLPGNAAIAVNPKIEYGKFAVGKEFFWSTNKPPHELGEEITEVDRKPGKFFLNKKYEPIFKISDDKNAYKIVAADFVSLKEGTGLVHIGSAFGEDDFELAKKEKLPILETLDATGRFKPEFKELEFLRGKGTSEANPLIVEYLISKGILWKKEKIVHRYPVCWRCSTPLIYKVQPAWFVKVLALKPKMLARNKKIDWHPKYLQEGRFGKGIETAPDWNISRSRFWGTPLPIWECQKCGKKEVVGSRDELRKKAGPAKNKYILMRHGESFSNTLKINSLKISNQHPLTEKGKQEVEKAADKLKKQKIDFIFSSPLRRTKETVEILAKRIGAKSIFYDQRIGEFSTGILDGQAYGAYQKMFPRLKDQFKQKPPGGETLVETRKRMFEVVNELEKKYDKKTILIISHGYPLWMLESALSGFSEEESINFLKNQGMFKLGEVREVEYKNVPRNDTGEVDFHRPYADCIIISCGCGGKAERIKDVFDCWFESGSMPFAEKHYPFENKEIFERNFPADFIAEYIAQTRGWFYTLHVLSTALFNKPSFKHVVTTGTILSEKGEKLSKSKKNFPDPWILFERYGVDAMRYYLMASPVMLSDNINFSEKDVDEIYKKYSLIAYNVLSFYKLYEHKLPKTHNLSPKTPRNVLDQWILSRLNSVIAEVTDSFDEYEIVKAVRPLLDLVQDISLWYVRRSRERIKDDSPDSQAALVTLREVLSKLSLLMAPVTPFLAEMIYQGIKIKNKESVHLEDWPKADKKLINKDLEAKMTEVREVVSEALRLRAEAGIKVRQPLSKLQITNHKLQKELELLELVKDEVNVKEITFGEEFKLDTAITAELKEEGLVREFIRNVQGLRKDLGLKHGQLVICQISGDKRMEEIFYRNEKEIKKEVGLEKFVVGGKKVFNAEREIDFEGQKLWVGIR